MIKKLAEYEAMGIQTIMLIDPERAFISRFKNGGLINIIESIQHLDGSRCVFDWHKIQELLDRVIGLNCAF